MDRGKLYPQLFESYKKCLVNKTARESQDVAAKTWNAVKAECTEKVVFQQRIKDKIIELETSA